MMTPAELIAHHKETGEYPSPLWCHALDVLAHVLKGDWRQTFFRHDGPNREYLDELRDHLDYKPKEVDSFLETRHNDFATERKWRRFDSEFGDLVVDRYLDGDRYPFDDFRKLTLPKPAVTIVLDMSIPWSERRSSAMTERHKLVYKFASDSNREGRPCRVIAAANQYINECPVQKWLFVLKDFEDPLFPSIWAAFETNSLTNSFINATQDYFIGTRHGGNGSHKAYNLAEDLDGDVILVEPYSRVYFKPEEVK